MIRIAPLFLILLVISCKSSEPVITPYQLRQNLESDLSTHQIKFYKVVAPNYRTIFSAPRYKTDEVILDIAPEAIKFEIIHKGTNAISKENYAYSFDKINSYEVEKSESSDNYSLTIYLKK